MPWEEYRNAVRMCRGRIRKAKAMTKLSMAMDAKTNKKGFYKYFGCKRKTRESVAPLTNGDGVQVMTDVGKAEVLNFFASVFTSHQASHISLSLTLGRGWESRIPPTVSKEQVQDLLKQQPQVYGP